VVTEVIDPCPTVMVSVFLRDHNFLLISSMAWPVLDAIDMSQLIGKML
jgi:hypothetical protein